MQIEEYQMVSNKDASVYQEAARTPESDFVDFLAANPWFIQEDAATLARLRAMASTPLAFEEA